MKKSLVLTAIAATLAAPAFAQSSVTIYGRLNVGAESQKIGDGDAKGAIVDNASRIGFKGTEDLGGGMKAMFLIEHGFDASTGKADTTFWGRESWVGLATKFGTVKLGNLGFSEAYLATADYISMHNHDTGTSSDALFGYVATTALKNAVSYSTPSFGGLVGHVQYGEAIGQDNPLSVAANYDAGALHLGFGYEELGDDKSTAVRGLYEMGAFTVGAYYNMVTGSGERNAWRLTGMYTMGNSEFHANYGMTDDVKGVANSGAAQWTLGYNYNLSKRTKLFAFYTNVINDPNAGYMSGAAGEDFSSAAVGIRHNF
ncbi:porin [Ideonella sp.]|uniref:porin n=1 Tax=Ideonella sp. TaxID=1929293 RepID=UPI003BB7FFA1